MHARLINGTANASLTSYVDVVQALEDLDKWSVNIFRIADLSNNQPLTCVMYNICTVRVALFRTRTYTYIWCPVSPR